MTKNAGSLKSLLAKSHDYLETRIDLVKLKTIDKSSDVISSVACVVAILLGLVLFLGMISIGLAMYIGHLLGRTYYGFFIMGGFYAIVILILYVARRQWIKTPVYNNMVRKILN